MLGDPVSLPRKKKLSSDERRSVLGALVSPTELTLDGGEPESKLESGLGDFSAPSLGGLDAADVEIPDDRFRRLREQVEQGQGFRWNPNSEQGARALQSQNEKLIGLAYGDTGLKADNLRARTDATRAKMERDAAMSEQRQQLLTEQIAKYRYSNSPAARELVADMQRELRSLRGDQGELARERATTERELRGARKDEVQASAKSKEAGAKLSDERVRDIQERRPAILREADARIQKLLLDPQYREIALRLQAKLVAIAEGRLEVQEEAAQIDALEAELKAIGKSPDTRSFGERVLPEAMGGKPSPLKAAAGRVAGEIDRAKGKLGVRSTGGPVDVPKLAGAGPVTLPEQRAVASPPPKSKPVGDTQPATAAGAIPGDAAAVDNSKSGAAMTRLRQIANNPKHPGYAKARRALKLPNVTQ